MRIGDQNCTNLASKRTMDLIKQLLILTEYRQSRAYPTLSLFSNKKKFDLKSLKVN